MQSPNRRARAAALAAAALLTLAGCGLGLEPTVQLITNRAEMAAYVDRFNAIQSDVKVEISYQEIPSQAVLDGVGGDAVVGEWLASPAIMDRLDALGDILKPGKLDPSAFYAGLIDMCSRDNRPYLIPLSFSLPAVIFERAAEDLPSMFMPLSTLQSMSAAFTARNKAGLVTAMGFSPLWAWPGELRPGDFLTTSALLFGARFRPGRNGLPAWDEIGLKKTVDFAQQWLRDTNGGVAADTAFAERNLVQPWYKLLASAKARFALVPFHELFALPEEKRRDLDFRWLSLDGAVPAMDDVLCVGVLRASRNKERARAFLQWFCSLPVQRSLLAVNQSRRIGVFGVTGGFSALKALNEVDLPQKHPIILGHIPAESMLVFPATLPDRWLVLRDEVIRPWIAQSAQGAEVRPLDKRLDEWQKSQKN
jgi:ABC-type glycerol-3-phosphate transport system substrate-binding protein